MAPGRFLIVEGLLGYHTEAIRDCFDIRVFLDPPESLRRKWKVLRDCSRRGYTTDQVLGELVRRHGPEILRFELVFADDSLEAIAEFGADAVRFTLASAASSGSIRWWSSR